MQSYEGTLLHQASEGFTVIFGAPVSQEDHARRAVLAALTLHQRLGAQLPAGMLAVCIGLHSGWVVGGSFGQDSQRLYTVVGVPAILATRLQQRAAPGTILLSAATYDLVSAEVQVETCGTLVLDEGLSSEPVYVVQGLRQRQAGMTGRALRAWSPFVGRAQELALLHDRLDAVRAGQGQVVGMAGEPGMGKTRLLTEFCRSLAGQPVTVYMGYCLSYGQMVPYLPVRDLLRQLCALIEGDAVEATIAAVQRQLQAIEVVAEEDIALVLQLLDLLVAPEPLAHLSPEVRKGRTFALLRRLLLHEAQRQPLILVVENLHWIDTTSEAWLASLVERLAGAAPLLLVTARPGYRPPWGAHSAATQVALSPLRARDSRVVVQAVLGPESLPEDRLREIVAHAEGNPFFLEELAWHAVEQGWTDTPGAVPETVHAVLASRMDRLRPEAKRLLQTAAVIGTGVSLLVLQAIAEQPEEHLQHSLAHLQRAEFLYETRLFPDLIYTFKHALTHEVAYGSLLQERRRVLHARITEAIENLYTDRLAEQVERLAHHALRGEVWDKALTYCRKAGEKALAQSAYREAVGYFEQALSALPHLPEQRDTRAQAIDLRLALRSALLPSADHERILVCLCEAEALAEALGDSRRVAQVSRFLSNHFLLRGMYDQAIDAAQRAIALATTSDDGVLCAQVNNFLGLAYRAQGNHGRAVDCFSPAMAFFEREHRRERLGDVITPAVLACAYLVASHAELGTFAEGRARGDEGLRIAEAVAHPPSLMIAWWGVGMLALRQGDLSRALSLLERAMGLCQNADLLLYFPQLAAPLGEAYTLSGRVADAVSLLTQAIDQSAATERARVETICSLPLGEAYVLAGRLEEAHACAERALARACARQERGRQAYAMHLLGEIAAQPALPERERVEAYYRQALALAEELGMRPLQAHCHRSLGTLYTRTGQREQACGALATAIELYQAMNMIFWIPRAETALAAVSGA